MKYLYKIVLQIKKKKDDIVININYLKENVKAPYTSNEWEIPKGKQNKNELYHIAAKRELEEATNINKEDYDCL